MVKHRNLQDLPIEDPHVRARTKKHYHAYPCRPVPHGSDSAKSSGKVAVMPTHQPSPSQTNPGTLSVWIWWSKTTFKAHSHSSLDSRYYSSSIWLGAGKAPPPPKRARLFFWPFNDPQRKNLDLLVILKPTIKNLTSELIRNNLIYVNGG